MDSTVVYEILFRGHVHQVLASSMYCKLLILRDIKVNQSKSQYYELVDN